jgi:hypothetical protein
VRDVARLQAAAQRSGTRLLTFTVETEVHLGAPSDVERFATGSPTQSAASPASSTGRRRPRVPRRRRRAPAVAA